MAKEAHAARKPKRTPAQQQSHQPGREHEMNPRPIYLRPGYAGAARLKGKAAFITGGDSGIGRAVAVAFAQEGADVAIVFKDDEMRDAEETKAVIERNGQRCLMLPCEVGDELSCLHAVDTAAKQFGRLDILVNNAAEQHPQESIEQITSRQLEATFRTNIFSMFYCVKAALPYLMKHPGASIINTTSVTAYRGSPKLLDYSATKGAIVGFTRSLSGQLAPKKIRVNAVAPGPIWTPLIPSTFPPEKVAAFGKNVPLERAGQPWEVAGCFVFLASDEASYLTGQVLHPNGGEIING
ncbi:MAG: 3-oxoacyl-(acyl-carrier-protein) reductase [Phycisphaerales bacterium]|nr:3-oxoacyl-(acyl-carrier-protein) reductase [Phycisphaerales bacterium]